MGLLSQTTDRKILNASTSGCDVCSCNLIPINLCKLKQFVSENNFECAFY